MFYYNNTSHLKVKSSTHYLQQKRRISAFTENTSFWTDC